MSCDHKWGDGPDEYSKLCGDFWPKLGTVEICDVCKTILINGDKIGHESWDHELNTSIAIGLDGEVLDRQLPNYTKKHQALYKEWGKSYNYSLEFNVIWNRKWDRGEVYRELLKRDQNKEEE